jgi:uncharacterized phage protein (TIGR01671 family)
MRGTEFRVWDLVRKKWLIEDEYIIFYDGTIYDVFIQNLDVMLLDMNKDAVLEQWTGLKDKNGAFIFEGDILKDCDSGEIVGVVKYDDEFGIYNCGALALKSFNSERVVIGNVHGNPELLHE